MPFCGSGAASSFFGMAQFIDGWLAHERRSGTVCSPVVRGSRSGIAFGAFNAHESGNSKRFFTASGLWRKRLRIRTETRGSMVLPRDMK